MKKQLLVMAGLLVWLTPTIAQASSENVLKSDQKREIVITPQIIENGKAKKLREHHVDVKWSDTTYRPLHYDDCEAVPAEKTLKLSPDKDEYVVDYQPMVKDTKPIPDLKLVPVISQDLGQSPTVDKAKLIKSDEAEPAVTDESSKRKGEKPTSQALTKEQPAATPVSELTANEGLSGDSKPTVIPSQADKSEIKSSKTSDVPKLKSTTEAPENDHQPSDLSNRRQVVEKPKTVVPDDLVGRKGYSDQISNADKGHFKMDDSTLAPSINCTASIVGKNEAGQTLFVDYVKGFRGQEKTYCPRCISGYQPLRSSVLIKFDQPFQTESLLYVKMPFQMDEPMLTPVAKSIVTGSQKGTEPSSSVAEKDQTQNSEKGAQLSQKESGHAKKRLSHKAKLTGAKYQKLTKKAAATTKSVIKTPKSSHRVLGSSVHSHADSQKRGTALPQTGEKQGSFLTLAGFGLLVGLVMVKLKKLF